MRAPRDTAAWFWPTLVTVLLGLCSFSTLTQHRLRETLAAANVTMRSLSDRLNTSAGANRGFLEVLRRHRLERPHVEGTVIGLGAPPAPAVLYYTVRPWCAACAENIPLLDTLALAFPGGVVGLSEDDTPKVSAYVVAQNVQFPVLAIARGTIEDLVPQTISPVSVLTFGDSVVSYFWGKLSAQDANDIRRVLARARVAQGTLPGQP